MKGMYSVAGISKQGFHQWLDRYLRAMDELYIPVENHTKFQLKTIPLINAYLPSFFYK